MTTNPTPNVPEHKTVMISSSPETKSHKKSNPWVWISVVLVVVVIVLIVMIFRSGGFQALTGNSVSVSGQDAATQLVKYLNDRTGGGVTFVEGSVKDKGSIYELSVSYQGQDIPVYVSKDGVYFIQGAIPISGPEVEVNPVGTPSEQTPPAEVPKSDKPVVEAFVFSYCPYGLQFEKALKPVYDSLKSKANISIVFIGAMHGEYEHVESLRQICIEKNYKRDKLFAYLDKFNANTNIGSCSGDEACLAPLLKTIYTSLQIDQTKIDSCMKTDAEKIYQANVARAQELGVSGSPTFVINGVESSVSRTPSSIAQAVCGAFNTAPSECSKNFSTSSASAGFGASSGGAATTGAQC